jgi:UDPglucose 6-dehydrogenase
MSLESAEMTKHAINAFLATSVVFTNELARLCEASGANAREVERGLRSEPRIGAGAYVSPGAPFAGGTLGRDVRFLEALGQREGVATSLIQGVVKSNAEHGRWLLDRVRDTLTGVKNPTVTLLGLVYKPGTSTLRRSGALELARTLRGAGAEVRAYDPAVSGHQPELDGLVDVCPTIADALRGADVAVVTTPWPEFRSLSATEFKAVVRRPVVVDPSWHVGATLGSDSEIQYIAPGLPGRRR